jgi:hypothetical protein
MLFGMLEGYHSIRELVIGMLSNAHKLSHLGVNYMVRRSTLSDANERRKSFPSLVIFTWKFTANTLKVYRTAG